MNNFFNVYYPIKNATKEQLITAFTSLSAKIYLVIILLLNISMWLGARYIARKVGTEQMALHYSVGFGIDYYGDTIRIYTIPLLGFLIALLNFILFTVVSNYRDKNFIGHILFSASVAANIILLASLLSIYIINF
jgi:hypothetical protein